MKIIPYGKQNINFQDILEVNKALKGSLITTGNKVEEFESKLVKYLKCGYATTCNSGTSALYLAFLSLHIKKSDIVLMPSVNFVASYNVASSIGAKIYLVDVDKCTGQITPENVLKTCAKYKIKQFKALITMFNGGAPLNCENYIRIKKKYNCYLIEDACHALGAYYKINKKKYMIGSCNHADISTFSLHPLKSITTGEGGVVTTNVKKIDNEIKNFRSLGIERNQKKHWIYDVINKGFNFRLTDFQCSLGMSQLKRINKFLEKRKNIAKRYDLNLKNIKGINIQLKENKYVSSNHLYLINIVNRNLGFKNKFINYMLKKRISLQYHYIPIYKFKIFKNKFSLQGSEDYYKSTVSLPIYYDLSISDQYKVINHIKKFFKKYY